MCDALRKKTPLLTDLTKTYIIPMCKKDDIEHPLSMAVTVHEGISNSVVVNSPGDDFLKYAFNDEYFQWLLRRGYIKVQEEIGS